MDDTLKPTTMRFGDHLKVKRRLYSHHGIYIGGQQVIHYAPPPGKDVDDGIGWRQLLGADSVVNTIHIAKLADFEFEDVRASVVPYGKPGSYPPMKAVARAESRIGENGYNLWGNNCEQFVGWSKQVQPQGTPVSLWDATWEGAMLGLSAGTRARNWSAMAVGAGLGALVAAAQKWLQARTLSAADAEFASFSSALYFGLADNHGPHPFGRSFQHASQITQHTNNELPKDSGETILFFYRGGFFKRETHKDWCVTERAIYQPGTRLLVDFHDVRCIGTHAGRLLVTTLDDTNHYFCCRYINATFLAAFLTSAVSGTEFDLEGNGITMWGRIKDAILGAREGS